ncbi:MAG: hypothetical protein Q7U84_10315 [Polynucleobacter sp.]|nr:hypothetical protein [Polynucleobacter sp.]
MAYFYTRNDDIIKSSVNKSFEELFTCSEERFAQWVDELCVAVAKQWDEQGQPPKAGVKLEDMGHEFERICRVDTDKMWFKDEQTREMDCIIDGARVSIANSFFPNILKAKDTVGEDKAISVYDLFAKQSARPKTLAVLAKCIREDGFYEFAPIYRPPTSYKGDLRREARRIVEEILTEEATGNGTRSLWIDASAKIEKRTPRINVKELKALKELGLLKKKHLNGVDLSKVSDDSLYRIRVYGINDKAAYVLPKVFRHLELGAGIAPNNFPSAIARLLYQHGTEKCKDQKEVVIYDPSMGFGGRLLGALSLRDRAVNYIGTDPNTENWIKELGISRYEYMERVFKSHVRYGEQFKGTYICSGSEDVASNKEFIKYKGKVDFIFTSPPYFSAEIYSDEPTQSSIKYKEYSSWRDNFLRTTLKTCAEWLKHDRFLAFNIADINVGSTQYPLEQDTVNILQELGLQYKGKLKMVLAISPSMRLKQQTRQPSMKNFCIVNGKWRKYEPIFIFYKK